MMPQPPSPGFVPGRLFQNYDQALQACQPGAYQFEELVNVVVEKTLIFNRGLASHMTFDLGMLRVLIGIGLAKGRGNKLAVLDFGGAAGHHHSIVEAALGGEPALEWSVVETGAMARRAGETIKKRNLRFFDSIEAATKDHDKYDIVFSSGALQCCPDPLRFLEQLTALGAANMFITRTQLSDGDAEIITVEQSLLSDNGPGPLPAGFSDKLIYYPNTFAPRSKVEELLSAKYEIRFSIREDGPSLFAGSVAANRYFGYFCRLRSTGKPASDPVRH